MRSPSPLLPQQQQQHARRGVLSRSLLTLACGVVLGTLIGLSWGGLFVATGAGGSSSGSIDSGGGGATLMRGGDSEQQQPQQKPQQQQQHSPMVQAVTSAPLRDVAWAAHDPLARQVTTDLRLWREMVVYVLPTATARENKEQSFFFRLLPGLLEHPRVRLTTTKQEADVYISIPFFTAEEEHRNLSASDWAKTIVIDNTDGFFAQHLTYRLAGQAFEPLAFFKRSFIKKSASRAEVPTNDKGDVDFPLGYWPYQRDFFPFAFAVADDYLHALWDDAESLLAWDDGAGRDVPVFCSHRPVVDTYDGGRANVTRWLEEMAIEGAVVGAVDGGNRIRGGGEYWALLKRARIVATANPSKWEGDYRLWEALASKALVFVDRLYAPLPCPLLDGQDVVFFDPFDRATFRRKLQHYLDHPAEARRIAMSGFTKALRCHRWVNRVDYMLSTAAFLLDPGFKESGVYLKETMMRTRATDHYSSSAHAGFGTAVAAANEANDGGEANTPPMSIEAYRSRIAAKVQSFEDEFWEHSQQQRIAHDVARRMK